jgi:hypothetical protein
MSLFWCGDLTALRKPAVMAQCLLLCCRTESEDQRCGTAEGDVRGGVPAHGRDDHTRHAARCRVCQETARLPGPGARGPDHRTQSKVFSVC